MRSIEIDNIRNFTSQLFAGTAFDGFLAVEASFSTAADFHIDGHLNPDFIGEEEMQREENREGIIYWKQIRPVCFEIIKGKKVPRQFKIVFKMPERVTDRFLQRNGLVTPAGEISGLFLNINYKNGKLFCTTGAAMKTFSLDKSIEIHWDDFMSDFLKKF